MCLCVFVCVCVCGGVIITVSRSLIVTSHANQNQSYVTFRRLKEVSSFISPDGHLSLPHLSFILMSCIHFQFFLRFFHSFFTSSLRLPFPSSLSMLILLPPASFLCFHSSISSSFSLHPHQPLFPFLHHYLSLKFSIFSSSSTVMSELKSSSHVLFSGLFLLNSFLLCFPLPH